MATHLSNIIDDHGGPQRRRGPTLHQPGAVRHQQGVNDQSCCRQAQGQAAEHPRVAPEGQAPHQLHSCLHRPCDAADGGRRRELHPDGDRRRELNPNGVRRRELHPDGDRRRELNPDGDRRRELHPGDDRRRELQPDGDRRRELHPDGDRWQPDDSSLKIRPDDTGPGSPVLSSKVLYSAVR